MAQDLDAIIRELDASYNPSRQSINDRINSLQGAEDADMQGLKGTQTEAFDQILQGSRERGVGAGGIPMGEQAKYTSTSFLPAVAKLKSNYVTARGGLSDALNSLNLDQNKTAMSIRETQQNRDFQAQQAELERQATARAQAAANSSSGALDAIFNKPAPQAAAAKPATDPTQQNAYNDVMTRVQQAGNNDKLLINDFNATAKSAAKGNIRDKYKLDIYRAQRPDLFAKQGQQAISNYNQLRF